MGPVDVEALGRVPSEPDHTRVGFLEAPRLARLGKGIYDAAGDVVAPEAALELFEAVDGERLEEIPPLVQPAADYDV